MYDHVKDSGKRESFGTGAVRDTAEGKGRYDLLPTYAIHRLARHFENGAVKYGDENWRKGIPLRRFIDSALRHLMKFLEGHRDEDHAAAAAWNILAMIETEEMIRRGVLPRSLDNLPNWTEEAHRPLDPPERKMPEPDLEPVEVEQMQQKAEPVELQQEAQDRKPPPAPSGPFAGLEGDYVHRTGFLNKELRHIHVTSDAAYRVFCDRAEVWHDLKPDDLREFLARGWWVLTPLMHEYRRLALHPDWDDRWRVNGDVIQYGDGQTWTDTRWTRDDFLGWVRDGYIVPVEQDECHPAPSLVERVNNTLRPVVRRVGQGVAWLRDN